MALLNTLKMQYWRYLVARIFAWSALVLYAINELAQRQKIDKISSIGIPHPHLSSIVFCVAMTFSIVFIMQTVFSRLDYIYTALVCIMISLTAELMSKVFDIYDGILGLLSVVIMLWLLRPDGRM